MCKAIGSGCARQRVTHHSTFKYALLFVPATAVKALCAHEVKSAIKELQCKTRWTISRQRTKQREMDGDLVPMRKVGMGPKKKYGKRQINVICRQFKKNAFLSSTKPKLQLVRPLANIEARTVRRILFYDLDQPVRIAALKPDLTKQNKLDILAWRKPWARRTWDEVLFCDKVCFGAQG